MTDRTVDFLRAEVRSVAQVGASLIRIVLGGGELERFTPTAHADQRVHVAFPAPGEAAPVAPTEVDGRHDYHDETARPELRSYTVRDWDVVTCELTVDFADHGVGPAVAWARTAAPGSIVYLNADVGWYRPPADTSWWLLAADLAGLPALARIIESLPPHANVTAVVEVPDPGDVQHWPDRPGLTTEWLVGSGNGIGPSRLASTVVAWQRPDGPGYVWAATEAAESRALRKHARGTWGLDLAHYDVVGYWLADKDAWMARYEQVEAELDVVWETALRETGSEDEAVEIYEAALERAGL